MYASGLTWKGSYHNEDAKISILFTIFTLLCVTTTYKTSPEVVVCFSWKCMGYNYDLIQGKKLVSWNFKV